MSEMNEFLAKVPFDLYDLSVFEQVACCGSFTRAAQEMGGDAKRGHSEDSGNGRAFETASFLKRTTRSVRPTPAGSFFCWSKANRFSTAFGIV